MGGHREIIEKRLITTFRAAVFPFDPKKHYPLVDSFKDGSAGHSTSAFALYAHGHKKDSLSLLAPFGLLYHDGKVMFSIGCFRRELDGRYYLVFSAPKGKQTSSKEEIDMVVDFVNAILDDKEINIAGTYVRFLDFEHYLGFLNAGFLPAKEHPWHPEAPEEDEHLSYSRIYLKDFFDGSGRIRERYPRQQINRFVNYIKRSQTDLVFLETKSEEDRSHVSRTANSIIQQHFDFLKKEKKAISSCFQDYLNLLDPLIWSVPSVFSYIGWLHNPNVETNHPISFFLGEKTSDKIIAVYCMITLRSDLAHIDFDGSGRNALIRYSHFMLFQELYNQGIEVVDMGGSEHPDLNWSKRKWGAKLNPTYWAVKLK